MSPRMSSPPAPLFLFLLPFLTLLLFDRAAGLLPPRPHIRRAGARRCCQGWPLLQRPPPSGGPRPLQQSSTTARLDGSGRLHSCLLSVLSVSARYSDNGCCVLAGLATKSMARAIIASTYIRQLRSGLPRCCLHGRSCRRDGTHL